MSSRSRLLWAALAVVVLGASAWFGWGLMFPPHKHMPPPVPVRVAVAQKQQNVEVVQHTVATVVSPDMLQVTAQITGMLTKADFQEGQLVKKGDPLFEIDPRPFQAALAQAQGQLAKDQATLAGARVDLTRYQTLAGSNAISKQTVDDQAATVAQDEGVVQAEEAAVNTARINVGYTHIVSPIDGKTGPLMIQPGNVITAASSTPLVTITQVQPILLSFFLPQNQLTQIQNQMAAGKLSAIVPMPGAPGGQEKAKVNFISNAVGANTGTIELRATFPNADMRLVPGQNVDVGVTIRDLSGATMVPRDAVNLGPDMAYVYVVDEDNIVSSKTVHILNDDGVNDAIEGGVKPGDRVIVEGQLRVVPGSKVQIRAKGPANQSNGAFSDMPS